MTISDPSKSRKPRSGGWVIKENLWLANFARTKISHQFFERQNFVVKTGPVFISSFSRLFQMSKNSEFFLKFNFFRSVGWLGAVGPDSWNFGLFFHLRLENFAKIIKIVKTGSKFCQTPNQNKP